MKFDLGDINFDAPFVPVPAVEQDGWILPSQETLDIYYEEKRDGAGVFWVKTEFGYSPVNERNLRRHLVGRGIIPAKQNHAKYEAVVGLIQSHKRVQGAGDLAGKHPGVIVSNGKKMLITSGPTIIRPQPGEWPTIRALIEGTLGQVDNGKQVLPFHCWAKIAYEAIASQTHHFGQALAIAGPVKCGKSLIQRLITELFGGRQADPWPFMQGRTAFNYDFISAEHLCFGDEMADLDIKSRRNIGGKLKTLVVNMAHRMEDKGKTAVLVEPCWRITMTVNEEPEYLAAIPPIDSSTRDKLMLFKATPCPLFATSAWREKSNVERLAMLAAELPAYVAFLKSLTIPAALAGDERMGVTSYHNGELLSMLRAVSPESHLLELIDEYLFAPDDRGNVTELIDGTANEHVKRLSRFGDCDRRLDRLLTHWQAAGNVFQRLSVQFPERVHRRTVNGSHKYRVSRPGLDVRTFVARTPHRS